jgi:hypothetical protein
MACCPARHRSRATPAIASLNVAASRTKQLNQRRQGQPFRFPSSVRLGSSEAAPSGFLLPGFSSWSAVPIAAMPPATIAAEAAFLATCLSFDGTLEDDFLFGFADVLGFLDLAVLDLAPARRGEGLTFCWQLAPPMMRGEISIKPYAIICPFTPSECRGNFR